jgi:hypothetical protein
MPSLVVLKETQFSSRKERCTVRTRRGPVCWLYGCSVGGCLLGLTSSPYLLLLPLHRLVIFFISTNPMSEKTGNIWYQSSTHASAIISFKASRRFCASTFLDFFPRAILSCALVYSANSKGKNQYRHCIKTCRHTVIAFPDLILLAHETTFRMRTPRRIILLCHR